MINVQIVRIDDALAQLARLESAPAAGSTAPIWNTGAPTRRDIIISKKELKSLFSNSDSQWVLKLLPTS